MIRKRDDTGGANGSSSTHVDNEATERLREAPVHTSREAVKRNAESGAERDTGGDGNAMEVDDVDAQRRARREKALQAQQVRQALEQEESSSEEESVSVHTSCVFLT